MLTIPETFATGRLILRRPVLADAEAVFEYARDPDVTRFMDWSTHTNSEAAIQFLESVIPRWDSGDEFYWAITLPAEDRPIGGISCRVHRRSADFGYVLNRRLVARPQAPAAQSR